MKIIVLSFTIQENVPLAAGYVVASARADPIVGKHTIDLWDEPCESYPTKKVRSLAHRILDAAPQVLAFSAYVWNLDLCLATAREVKEHNPSITIILGGPAATFSSSHILENYPCIDYITRGEGEHAFTELIKSLLEKKQPIGIKSISWKHGGKLIENPGRPGIERLDDVPSPYLSGVLDPKHDILIETHRGCVFKCGYCLEARGYSGIRSFSVGRVEQEVEWAKSRGVQRISFVNSIYNINPQRVEELSVMLAKHKGSGMQFSVDTYAMLLNEKIAGLYQKAGIYGTDLGLQSINRETLINMRRPYISQESFREKHKLLRDRNIKTSIHIILGLPGDTFETFRQTFEFAASVEPTNVAAFRLLVLPGTQFYLERQKFKLVSSPEPPFRTISNYSFSKDSILDAESFAESYYKEFLMKNEYKRITNPILA